MINDLINLFVDTANLVLQRLDQALELLKEISEKLDN